MGWNVQFRWAMWSFYLVMGITRYLRHFLTHAPSRSIFSVAHGRITGTLLSALTFNRFLLYHHSGWLVAVCRAWEGFYPLRSPLQSGYQIIYPLHNLLLSRSLLQNDLGRDVAIVPTNASPFLLPRTLLTHEKYICHLYHHRPTNPSILLSVHSVDRHIC